MKSTLNIHWQDWCWRWGLNTLAPNVKSWLIRKDPDAGKDWRHEEKGMTEDEMAGWHHQLNGHEFEWTLGVGDGQGGLVCWDSWGCKESDMTEWLNWTELLYITEDFNYSIFYDCFHIYILIYISLIKSKHISSPKYVTFYSALLYHIHVFI